MERVTRSFLCSGRSGAGDPLCAPRRGFGSEGTGSPGDRASRSLTASSGPAAQPRAFDLRLRGPTPSGVSFPSGRIRGSLAWMMRAKSLATWLLTMIPLAGVAMEVSEARAQATVPAMQVSIQGPSGPVAPGAIVVLKTGLSLAQPVGSVRYAWTLLGRPPLPNVRTDLSYLPIPGGIVQAGEVYQVMVTVTATVGGASHTAQDRAVFSVNARPSGGTCTATATSLPVIAGTTPVTLSTSGWSDPEGQALSFRFVAERVDSAGNPVASTALPNHPHGALTLLGAPQASAKGATYTGPVMTDIGPTTLQISCVATDAIGLSSEVMAAPLPLTSSLPTTIALRPYAHPRLPEAGGSVVLRAQADLMDGVEAVRYEWKQLDGPRVELDDVSSPSVTIPQGVLKGRQAYRFSVSISATRAGTRMQGTSELAFYVNGAPTPGSCRLEAERGLVAGETATVIASGWTDDQAGPLTMAVGHIQGGASTRLTPPLPIGEAQFTLPGVQSLALFCDVMDSSGARTRQLLRPRTIVVRRRVAPSPVAPSPVAPSRPRK